jgi:hypothetical protein
VYLRYWSSRPHGGCDCFATKADDPDLLIGVELPIELPARYAWACMKHVAGFPNSAGTRITVFALLRVQSWASGRDFSRANEHQCRQHPQSRIYSAARPTVVRFRTAAFAVMPARGVKTAI